MRNYPLSLIFLDTCFGFLILAVNMLTIYAGYNCHSYMTAQSLAPFLNNNLIMKKLQLNIKKLPLNLDMKITRYFHEYMSCKSHTSILDTIILGLKNVTYFIRGISLIE